LKFTFYTDKGAREKHCLSFYERNPAGRGLDFTENPDGKEDFIRYAVNLHCLKPVADTKKSTLPPLEDLAEGAIARLHAVPKNGSEPRRELDATFRTIGTQLDWYPGDKSTCVQDLRLNKLLGAGRAMSTRRISDPEGAKIMTMSFKHAAGTTLTIAKHNIKIKYFEQTSNLRVDADATAGGKQQVSAQGRRMVLIYITNMHARSTLSPELCTGK
jgi:hypothetical protein